MPISKLRRSATAVFVTCALSTTCAFAQHTEADTWVDPVDAPAQIMPLATHELLLDIVRSADQYVAVGAYGDVLVSKAGQDWQQVEVPTRTTFTAVAGVDNQVWAVGHAGVIAHSDDAGEHWQIQRKDPWHPPKHGSNAAKDPRQGAPLLDVLFTDTTHGFAVGAYSLALRTQDGGKTWTTMIVAAPAKPENDDASTSADSQPATDSSGVLDESNMTLEQEPNPHLNAIAHTGSGGLFIVGERGSAFRSRDNGATWKRLKLPYDGSMFGVLGYEADHIIAFGLRGHVYESTDLGDHWTKLETGTELSLMGGAALPDDGVVIVGANGIVLMRSNATEPLKSYVDQPAGIIAAVLPTQQGSLLIAGENGISTFQPH
ncbi:MAG: hypothetical protein ABI304_08990 [Rudaea sp.]